MGVVAYLVFLFQLAIIVRVVLSWFPLSGGAGRSVMDVLVRITEPVLGPVRRVLPTMAGLDLSPVVVILLLNVLLRLL